MALQKIVTNIDGTIRHAQMEGKDYLVAPMVMMAEGVINGSGGSLYYPKEELAKTPAVWNHKPVVVYHPVCNGESVSACDPDILSTQKVGVIMNTRFTDDGKLKAEAWLETSRIKEVDERVLEALESDTVMELSTGLFTDNESVDGDFEGTPYEAIARNYRPDHLALLPDKKGAYSVEAGAGLLRNEMSFDNIRGSLQTQVRSQFPSNDKDGFGPWVADVYNDFFILEQGNDLLKVNYEVKDEEVVIGSESTKVKRKTEYVTTDGSFVGNANVQYVSNHKELDMSKEELVGQLIANKATLWEDKDKDFLMGLKEDDLKKFTPVVNKEITIKVEKTAVQLAAENGASSPAPAETSAPVINADDKPVTAEEYIANAPNGIRDMLSAGLQTHEAQRQGLIASIRANKKNVFTAEQLAPKPLGELQALAALCVEEKTQKSAPLYTGASAPAPIENEVTEEPLVAPVMSWD